MVPCFDAVITQHSTAIRKAPTAHNQHSQCPNPSTTKHQNTVTPHLLRGKVQRSDAPLAGVRVGPLFQESLHPVQVSKISSLQQRCGRHSDFWKAWQWGALLSFPPCVRRREEALALPATRGACRAGSANDPGGAIASAAGSSTPKTGAPEELHGRGAGGRRLAIPRWPPPAGPAKLAHALQPGIAEL